MREIINLSVGQCGNQIGKQFWEMMCGEHGLSETGEYIGNSQVQLERIGVYFHHVGGKKYVPRSIMIDLEPGVIDSIKATPYGKLYQPSSFITENSGAGNNWAIGNRTSGAESVGRVLEQVRKEAEKADCLQGFQLFHSLGGGTGSGFGTLILSKLREEFPDRILSTYSVVPSSKSSDVVIEPYNTVLSLEVLIENSNLTYCIDNGALNELCQDKLKIQRPTHDDMNQLISTCVSGTTASLRFPGQLNADLRKLAVNMVPFEKLHFMITGCTPMTNAVNKDYAKLSVPDLVREMFDPRNVMVSCNTSKGKYLTAACVFRGNVSTKEVDEHILKIQKKNEGNFVSWIPSNVKTVVCDVPPVGVEMSATFIGNTTSIQELFTKTYDDCKKMFKSKAYLHNYEDEGMTEDDFKSAMASLRDLNGLYRSFQANDDVEVNTNEE
jgi:tubulin beta